jgi:hypothetical protein
VISLKLFTARKDRNRITAATTPKIHTLNTTPRPTFIALEMWRWYKAGAGMPTMMRVVKTFGMPRYLHSARPGIKQPPGYRGSGFHVFEKGRQFMKGMSTWATKMLKRRRKVSRMMMRWVVEIWAKTRWRRHRIPNFESEVVRGQTICKAVVSFNAFPIVEGWRAARWWPVPPMRMRTADRC